MAENARRQPNANCVTEWRGRNAALGSSLYRGGGEHKRRYCYYPTNGDYIDVVTVFQFVVTCNGVFPILMNDQCWEVLNRVVCYFLVVIHHLNQESWQSDDGEFYGKYLHTVIYFDQQDEDLLLRRR